MRTRGVVGLLAALAVIVATQTPSPTITSTGSAAAQGPADVDFADLVVRPCDALQHEQALALGYVKLGAKSDGSTASGSLSCQWFGSGALLDISARRTTYDLFRMRARLGGEIIQIAGRDTFRSVKKEDHLCSLTIVLGYDQTLMVIVVADPADASNPCDRATAAAQIVLANLR